MAAILSGLALTVASHPAVAEPIALPVQVTDGASWVVESIRERIDERGGEPRRIESKSRFAIRYQAQADGGLLRVTPTEGGLYGEVEGVSLKEFDLPLEIQVDESLTPLRLQNWPVVREALFRFFDAQAAKNPALSPKVADAVKGIFRDLPAEQVPVTMAPVFTYLGLGQGLSLSRGQPTTYEDQLPNPLGGGLIKTNAAFVLESYDQSAGRAVVVWTQALDPKSLAANLRSSMRALVDRAGIPGDQAKMEEAMAQASMARDDRCRFEIHIPSGLAITAECASTLDISAQNRKARRIDRWTITQTVPETP